MHSILTYWRLDWLMTAMLILLTVIYYYTGGFLQYKKSRYFLSGYALIIIAVASPLQFLGENYLMSAHMVCHVILVLIAAPLLVLGIPDSGNKNLSAFSEWLVKHPWLPWMAGVCVMWFWHIPEIFNALSQTTNISFRWVHLLPDIHQLSLVLAGMLFSWPVLGPCLSLRLKTMNAVLYLSAACIFCSILGLMITFAPAGIYTQYNHLVDRYGFLDMIRNENGISVAVDQQLAGLIMWVPGCLIYLSVSVYLLMKWFKEKTVQSLSSNNKFSHE